MLRILKVRSINSVFILKDLNFLFRRDNFVRKKDDLFFCNETHSSKI